ncbi:hypothetical protein Tco_0146388 [Tanacetum coccineum]
MASGDIDRDAEYALSKLLQMGTVAEYQNEFEMLIKIVTIPKSLLKSFYISGLKLDLQRLLFRSNPKTLDDAFSLALAVEARFTDQQLLEFLRSYPSNLGEAFFRARITEARFEDENNQAVDTNVGDQEDPDMKNKQENQDDPNIAIPDQVLEESILHTSDKVEVVPTSMVSTFEEHGCQESMSRSGIYESGISGLVPQLRDAKDKPYRAMLDAAALKAKLNSLQLQSPLGQCLNDQYIKKKKMKTAMQRRLWDPRIKIYFRHHLEDKVVVKDQQTLEVAPYPDTTPNRVVSISAFIESSLRASKVRIKKVLFTGTIHGIVQGEAFFRARITDACFEDENNQAVDTNVGDQEDLNADDDTNNDDFGCSFPPHKGVDLTVEVAVLENIKSNLKKDEDEQGKKKKNKGIIKFFKVGANKVSNPNRVFNDVGRVGYSKANGKWVPARKIEDGWYLYDELGSKLYFEYLIKNVPQLSDDKHADYNKKHKREIQRRIWNPEIKRIFKTSP